MEKAVLEVDEPNTAYDVLKKEKIAEMRRAVIDRLLLYNKYFVGSAVGRLFVWFCIAIRQVFRRDDHWSPLRS